MSTAIKLPVPDRVKPSFVIFDIRALWRSNLSVRVPGCQKITNDVNPMWHRKRYSCTLMATVCVKGLNSSGPCTQMFSTLPLMCYYNHSGWLIAVVHWTHTRYIPQRWPVWSPHAAQWKLSLCISVYVCRCVCRELSVSRRRVSMHTRWPTWLESRFTAIPPFHWPTSSSTYELPLMLAVVCPSVCHTRGSIKMVEQTS